MTKSETKKAETSLETVGKPWDLFRSQISELRGKVVSAFRTAISEPLQNFLAKRYMKTATPKSNPKLRWLLSCTRYAKNRTLGYTILAAKNTLACFMTGRTRATTILSLIATRRGQVIRPCRAGATPTGTIRSIAVLTMMPKEYSPREMHMQRQ